MLLCTMITSNGVLKELLGLGGEESFCSLNKDFEVGKKGLRRSLVSLLGILGPGPLEELLRKL